MLFSAALPLLAFGWYAQRGMRDRLEKRLYEVYLPELADTGADLVAARLEQVQQRCSVLAVAARDALSGDGTADRIEAFRDLVVFTPGVNEDFDLLLLADPDGQVLITHESPRLDRENSAARRLLLPDSVAAEAWFREAARIGSYWQNRHLSPFRHRVEEFDGKPRSRNPDDYSLGLAISVPSAAGRIGVLYGLVRWKHIQDALDDRARFLIDNAQFRSAQVFLCDETGLCLAHTERSRYGSRLEPESLRSAIASIEVNGANPRGHHAYDDVAGLAYMAGFALVPLSPLHWMFGIQVTQHELFATSNDFGKVLLAVIGVTVALLFLWSILASRRIVGPVQRLAAATEAIARGDLAARVPERGRDEIAELGRAFNRMAGDLANSREQLREAERQAAWAEMARQVAHEIKNPLTPLRMSAQMVQKAKREGDPRLTELTDRLAKTVLDQTDALARIATDFRQFAGAPTRHLEVVAADAVLAEIEEFYAGLAAQSRVRLQILRRAEGAQVECDRQELRRLLINLIDNALAAPAQSLVEVVATREFPGDTKLEPNRPGRPSVVIRIQDDGPGIPAEARSRLFEPYFTTKSSGTGLGLAICKKIAQAHGGAIILEHSSLGRTVFRVELPLWSGSWAMSNTRPEPPLS